MGVSDRQVGLMAAAAPVDKCIAVCVDGSADCLVNEGAALGAFCVLELRVRELCAAPGRSHVGRAI